jgi:hypothetical protein
MTELSVFERIKDLRKVCRLLSMLKSQLIQKLPHYSHDALFLKNDEITTGLLNNITEIKIHLLTGQLLYFHNEEGSTIDLISDEIPRQVKRIVSNYGLNMPQIPDLRNLNIADLSYYLDFAAKANRSLELFSMKLTGQFTQVHLWPDGFDFSIEWFTGKKDEQIGIGISPGDEDYKTPYLYVNPYPFVDEITEQVLPVGIWHTTRWKGIKVEWKDLEKNQDIEISNQIHDLFQLSLRNFRQ